MRTIDAAKLEAFEQEQLARLRARDAAMHEMAEEGCITQEMLEEFDTPDPDAYDDGEPVDPAPTTKPNRMRKQRKRVRKGKRGVGERVQSMLKQRDKLMHELKDMGWPDHEDGQLRRQAMVDRITRLETRINRIMCGDRRILGY